MQHSTHMTLKSVLSHATIPRVSFTISTDITPSSVLRAIRVNYHVRIDCPVCSTHMTNRSVIQTGIHAQVHDVVSVWLWLHFVVPRRSTSQGQVSSLLLWRTKCLGPSVFTHIKIAWNCHIHMFHARRHKICSFSSHLQALCVGGPCVSRRQCVGTQHI